MNGRYAFLVIIAAALAVAGVFVVADSGESSATGGFTIDAQVSPYNGGWVEQNTIDINGAKYAAVYAEPGEGFHFVEWTEGGAQVSTQALYVFELNANRDLVAVFAEGNMTYTITVGNDKPQMGIASGSGSYRNHEQTVVTAIPNEGYRFVGWNENGVQVSTESSYMFYVSSNRTLIADFEPIIYNVTIVDAENGAAAANPAQAGTGTTVALTATPNEGYAFKEWSIVAGGPVEISDDNTFIMPPRDVAIAPVFERIYTVTIVGAEGGSVTAEPAQGIAGTEIALTAEPAEGWEFSEWSAPEGVTIADDKFVMPEADVTISAVFTKIVYTITVKQVEHGTATADPLETTMGETVKLTATADEGYAFTQWTFADGLEITVAEDGTFAMPAANVTVIPGYVRVFTITFLNSDLSTYGTVVVPDGGTINAPAGTPTQAPTDQHQYVFTGWSDGFVDGETVATADATYTAQFVSTVRTYSVTFMNGDTVVSQQTLPYGSVIVAPDENPSMSGHRFEGWLGYSEGMTVTGNATFTADFSANHAGLFDGEMGMVVITVIAIIIIAVIGVLLLAHYEVIDLKIGNRQKRSA